MPEQADGLMEGFQLWLNLHSADKMMAPAWHDIPGEQVPVFEAAGAGVRVIAGRSHGVAGAMQRPRTEPLYLDIQLDAGASFAQPLPADHNGFVYVYRGALQVGGTEVPAQRMAILSNQNAAADGVLLQAGPAPARALLIAGAPLNEPIAQHGPFVMNTREELVQAVQDFQAGRIG